MDVRRTSKVLNSKILEKQSSKKQVPSGEKKAGGQVEEITSASGDKYTVHKVFGKA